MTHRFGIRIEVVDDNDLRNSLAMVLRAQGFQVRAHQSGPDYLSVERTSGIRLMLLDVRMPFISGLKLHAETRRGSDQ